MRSGGVSPAPRALTVDKAGREGQHDAVRRQDGISFGVKTVEEGAWVVATRVSLPQNFALSLREPGRCRKRSRERCPRPRSKWGFRRGTTALRGARRRGTTARRGTLGARGVRAVPMVQGFRSTTADVPRGERSVDRSLCVPPDTRALRASPRVCQFQIVLRQPVTGHFVDRQCLRSMARRCLDNKPLWYCCCRYLS